MRPIDANKLKQGLETLCKDERVSMSAVAYFAIIGFIDQLPTIEAEPTADTGRLCARIVASNWTINVPSLNFDGKCSNCCTPVFGTDRYCRECGAKLVEGDSDGQ